MKIILSRKGFDSTYGGYPSIITDKNEMVSFPIPSIEKDDLLYNHYKTKNGNNYDKFIKDHIGKDGKIRLKGERKEIEKCGCHFDPDLREKPGLFGQVGSAQGHLDNEKHKIKEGDLFLFFGWFNYESEAKNNDYIYGFHAIFGYLLISAKIELTKYNDENKTEIKHYQSIKHHPHVRYLDKFNKRKKNNTLYIGKKSGVFKFTENLILTEKGKSRSMWKPELFENIEITYHKRGGKYGMKDRYFQSAHIGQEFIIKDYSSCKDGWEKIIPNDCL